MKEWLLSVVCLSILLCVLELTLSEGSTKKYIIGAIGIATLFSFVAPIQFIKNSTTGSMTIVSVNEENALEINIENQSKWLSDSIETKVTERLNKMGGICDTSVTIRNMKIESISVFVKKNGINESGSNIYTIDTVKEAVNTVISMDDSKLHIYGKLE